MVDKIVSSFFLFLSLSCNPSSYAVDDSAEQEHPNLQVSASLINKSIQIYTYQPPSKESFFYSSVAIYEREKWDLIVFLSIPKNFKIVNA